MARFERRPADIERIGPWDVEKNPFVGTRQLSGLKILAMLYASQRFIRGVFGGRLEFRTRIPGLQPDVPLEHARWFATLGFSTEVLARIGQFARGGDRR